MARIFNVETSVCHESDRQTDGRVVVHVIYWHTDEKKQTDIYAGRWMWQTDRYTDGHTLMDT